MLFEIEAHAGAAPIVAHRGDVRRLAARQGQTDRVVEPAHPPVIEEDGERQLARRPARLCRSSISPASSYWPKLRIERVLFGVSDRSKAPPRNVQRPR